MTSDQRTCIDCGGVLPPYKTCPATRCEPCNKIKRRIKTRATVTCVDCGATFDPPEHTGTMPERCLPCKIERKRLTVNEKSRRWREANVEKNKAQMRAAHARRKQRPDFKDKRNQYELTRKYGITPADFDLLLEQQGGVCAICSGPRSGAGKRFHVDHHHETGQVRGLLCGNCNTAIGLLGDDPERAEKVAVYLRR